MKTLKTVLLTAMVLLIAACNKETDPGDFGDIQVPDIAQLEQEVAADATQSPSEVTFTTRGAWSSSITQTRAGIPDWISISPDHGDEAGSYTIRISLTPNTGEEARTAVITIRCNGSEIQITITQEAGEEDPDDSNVPDKQVIYILHKITGYNEQNKLRMEMEYEFADSPDPAADPEFMELRSFTIRKADEEGMLSVAAAYTFTYSEEYDMTSYEHTFNTGEGLQKESGELYGRFYGNDGRAEYGSSILTLPGDETERLSFDCTYGIGTFNSNKLLETNRYSSLSAKTTVDRYKWEQDDYGPTESWDNISSVVWDAETSDNNRQEYTYDYEGGWLDWSFFLANLPANRIIFPGDPLLMLVNEPNYLRGLGFLGEGSQDLFVKAVTTHGDESLTQDFTFERREVENEAETAVPVIITCTTKDSGDESTRTYHVQFIRHVVE